jgi:hypothetical protein
VCVCGGLFVGVTIGEWKRGGECTGRVSDL